MINNQGNGNRLQQILKGFFFSQMQIKMCFSFYGHVRVNFRICLFRQPPFFPSLTPIESEECVHLILKVVRFFKYSRKKKRNHFQLFQLGHRKKISEHMIHIVENDCE